MQEISIRHLPYGLGPYEQYGYERIPGNPCPGDFVIIHAIIEPYDEQAPAVLRYTLNGRECPPVEGRKIQEHAGIRECVRFEAGRFYAGDRVEYLIEAPGENGPVRTKRHSFTVYEEESFVLAEKIRLADHAAELSFQARGVFQPRLYFCFKNGSLHILCNLDDRKAQGDNGCTLVEKEPGIFAYVDGRTGRWVEIGLQPFRFSVKDEHGCTVMESDESLEAFLTVTGEQDASNGRIKYRFRSDARSFLGFGERFDRMNRKGTVTDTLVYEKFTNQGEKTYLPIPFFITERGAGVYVNSSFYTRFDISNKMEGLLEVESAYNARHAYLEIQVFFGKPAEILRNFAQVTGRPALPPRWCFGPWMSSNRWNTQEETLRQVEAMKEYEIPATVLVLEAWSDEATFYIFNDALYSPVAGSEVLRYDNFTFRPDGKWPDPKEMVDYIHDSGLKLILWQIPVIKHFEAVENEQHAADERHVVENGFCVKYGDGSPYRITDNWFGKSLLMDFTNPDAVKWWFDKRRYLVEELQVDGFKTDGGEFLYETDTRFYDGSGGDEMRNLYPVSYEAAYRDFMGESRITFSRAGFTGAQKYPIHWAGDQESSFKELRSVLIAGLTAGLSGVPFWSFDIGGFAGKLPSVELYIRGTQLAAFCPVMQFHSEPVEGHRNNDRTPWNVAAYNNDLRALDIYRKYANIRMSLLPYIYREAQYSADRCEPLMRQLAVDFPDDPVVYSTEDEYLFGRSLLVAPITGDCCRQRDIYLPEGEWLDLWDGTGYTGKAVIKYPCDLERIPVFIRHNSVIPLNLGEDRQLGNFVGNRLDRYENLCFLIAGKPDDFKFEDDLGNTLLLEASSTSPIRFISGNVQSVSIISCEKRTAYEQACSRYFQSGNGYIYEFRNL